MRIIGVLITAGATLLVLSAPALTSAGSAAACQPQPRGNERLLACAAGTAVVKPVGEASYMLHGSHCYLGKSGARLYFGRKPSPLYIVVHRTSAGKADVIDGGLRVKSTGDDLTISGTARLQSGLKRGMFKVFEQLGDGVEGNRVFTGSWNCSGPVRR